LTSPPFTLLALVQNKNKLNYGSNSLLALVELKKNSPSTLDLIITLLALKSSAFLIYFHFLREGKIYIYVVFVNSDTIVLIIVII